MNKGPKLAAVVAVSLLLTACAAGGIESANAVHHGLASQFLLGFWHGIIAPVTLLVELLHKLWPHNIPWPNVRMYEAKADSAAYDLGFFLGLGGGPAIVIRRGWRSRD